MSLSLHYERGFTQGYEQYTGNLTGQTWRGRDGVQRAYGYVYDPLNRLLQGDFVARTGGAGSLNGAWRVEEDRYRLSFVSYDDNGNIATLRRRGLLAGATRLGPAQYGPVDALTYRYQGNRLLAVDDQVTTNQLPRPQGYEGAPSSLAGDFQEGGTRLGEEYVYDANGSLTQDRNKGISGIAYNHLNLPRLIHFGLGADSLVFRYSAAGQKVAKLVYQTGKPMQRTDYLGPYQYEQDSLRFFPHAEGRVLRWVSPTSGVVRYEREYTLQDHLGNLRLAYRLGQVRTYVAGLEPGEAERERRQFDSLSVSPPVAQLVGPRARSGQYAARLNAGGSTPQPLGPLKQLAVQRGDTVSVTAPGLYPQAVEHNFWFSLASFLTGLLQPSPSQPTPPEGVRRGGLPLLQVGVVAGLAAVPQLSGGVPRGYVRLLVFDADSNLVSQQTQQLSAAALNNYEALRLQVVVPQDGYVSAYVGNESNVDVFFDDVTVEHRQGLQVQETQYDPTGLELAGLTRETPGLKPLNQYKFNGKEFQADLGLNWNHQDWRFIDLARGPVWLSVDPEVENGQESMSPYVFNFNNAVRFKDPNGRCPTCPDKPKDGAIYESHNTYYVAKGGSWSKTLPEATVVGAYGAPAINYTSSEQSVIAGYSAGYNSSVDKFNGFNANVTGFRAEQTNKTTDAVWKGLLKAVGFEASVNGKYGNEDKNVQGKVTGSALLAEATANGGILTGQKQEVGFSAGASVGVYGLRAKFEGSATFMGIKVTGGVAPSIGSANATLGADAKFNVATGNTTLNATWGASLGAGATFKFGIDLPMRKMVGL
ncbi:hypothetical protein IC235_13135 [Hymenobacter sp. BT664]|uniref:RHS repeat-associated core domain-containing protein n=1 Tax=Hymenobacter montanus TaxID=2771359 RepID=A0A927GJT6_9BACT|nr:hypothetical protein [Hymenobacter montanus]MBD2768833.1 hypothetical protein [Hymenobacter montanus]